MKKYVGGRANPSPPVFFFEKYSKIVNFLGNFAQILYSTQCKRCCPQTCIFQKEACKRINSPLKDRKIPPKCVRMCVCLKKHLSPPPPPPWTLSIVFNYGIRSRTEPRGRRLLSHNIRSNGNQFINIHNACS